jgi:hypothetical protein
MVAVVHGHKSGPRESRPRPAGPSHRLEARRTGRGPGGPGADVSDAGWVPRLSATFVRWPWPGAKAMLASRPGRRLHAENA